tara:strand:+ start:293 stop:520 length:228 start_codon:yes stop_codon:yes gene_type:complete
MSAKVGDLVKWYEIYADGTLVKDVGSGIVMNIKNMNYYGGDGSHKNKLYEVYRFKHADLHSFIDYHIEKLETKNG